MSRWYNKASEDNRIDESGARPSEVPDFVDLHPRTRRVENYAPPVHAVRPSKPPSRWANLRDDIITFAYGHERLLGSPQRITTDSRNRLIVVDAAGSAVQVLAEAETESFRIATGAHRRVVKPSGVAVDGDDDIYIADSEQGVIAVYDGNGRFIRYIGKLAKDENLFHYPTGIAIDRRTGVLYVLDSERHLLFLLDLNGKLIKRVGRYEGNDTVVDFEYPTDISVGDHALAIMDAGATRVWITDLEGRPVHHFSFAPRERSGMCDVSGLTVDSSSNIYIATRGQGIRIYSTSGKLLSTFGGNSDSSVTFRVPSGLTVEAHDRLYVADRDARRVQVFQLERPAPLIMAAGE
jgi:sugar lactone lactonase YvrE